MKSSNSTLGALLYSPNQYVIPVFQRYYRWDQPEWEKLRDDLAELRQPRRTGRPFMGFLVLVPESVMPGQRRLAGRDIGVVATIKLLLRLKVILKWRTRVAGLLPDEASAFRLLSAVATGISVNRESNQTKSRNSQAGDLFDPSGTAWSRRFTARYLIRCRTSSSRSCP